MATTAVVAASDTPTLITTPGEDVTNVTIFNDSGNWVRLYAAASEVPPELDSHFARLEPNGVVKAETLADLDLSVAGVRVYAWAEGLGATLQVSHA